jgi:hypothetical protein
MATMFLENLKASASDFLRPNLFQVVFSGNIFGKHEFGFLTKAATYPFMTYNTTSVQYNNLPRHFANSVDYDPITFEFLVDDGLKVLNFFHNWRRLVMNDGNRTFNYKDEYSGNIEIELWNRKQLMRAKCTILDAFPVNIDNVALAHDANDQIMSINVSFRYDDVVYEFDEGVSFAGIKDTLFDLAQGSIGNGIDAIKAGVESAANKIPASAVQNVFGGVGQNSSFPSSEEAISAKSKEIFSRATGGGIGVTNATNRAKEYARGVFQNKAQGVKSRVKNSIVNKIKSWSPF